MTWARTSRPDREQRIAERAQRNAAQAQTCLPRRAAVVGGGTAGPAAKVKPWRSEAYRRAVASLPCANCCRVGNSQAAHANLGKSMGSKTSDATCFPLCVACHEGLDRGAMFTKEKRREMEALWGAQTRAVVEGMGLCPQINIPKE